MSIADGLRISISAGITGTSTAMTKEACSLSADRKKATIAATGKRLIDPLAAVSVWVGASAGEAVEVPADTYVFYHGGGHVEFHTEAFPGAGDNVYISGKYLPFAVVSECRNININNQFEVKDVTSMLAAATGWKSNKATLRDGSVTLSGFLDDAVLNYLDPDAMDLLCFVEVTYASLFVWQAIGVLQSYAVGIDYSDMVTNERTINTTGPVWYSAI